MQKTNVYFFLAIKLITNLGGVAAILFLSAGTFSYPIGWLFVVLSIIIALVYVVVMLCKYPALLKKRLIYKENNFRQQIVIVTSLIISIMILCSAGLSFRFNWICLPDERLVVSVALFVCASYIYANVIRVNSFLTSEITVQNEQEVIQSGPYRFVRHPMYSAMVLFMLAAAILLGSVLSIAVSILFFPVLILRIQNEEQILKKDLPGYIEYTQKVKYKLIPYFW